SPDPVSRRGGHRRRVIVKLPGLYTWGVTMNHGHDHAHHAGWFLGRRRLLQAGLLGCLGVGPAGLARAAEAKVSRSRTGRGPAAIRSCILLFYYGGPSHLDTWDLKPHAPQEVRGEFRPI